MTEERERQYQDEVMRWHRSWENASGLLDYWKRQAIGAYTWAIIATTLLCASIMWRLP